MSDVSIYIYFYEGEHLTRNLIDSIVKFTHNINYEIILIDDGSPSKIGEKFREEGYKVIINNDNMGIPHSINIALKHQSKIKVISQNDIIVSENWLYNLLIFWEKYPDFLYVSPFAFNDINLNCNDFNTLVKRYKKDFEQLIYHQYWGGLWLCDNRIVEKNGLYDERFKYFADDCDWCMRLNLNEIPTASTGSSLIMHLTSQTTPQFSTELGNCLSILEEKWKEAPRKPNALIDGVHYTNHPLYNSSCDKYFYSPNSMKGRAWL